MSKDYGEPWNFEEKTDIGFIKIRPREGFNQYSIESDDFRRRAVACVNALANIPDSMIAEAGRVLIANHFRPQCKILDPHRNHSSYTLEFPCAEVEFLDDLSDNSIIHALKRQRLKHTDFGELNAAIDAMEER